MLRDTLGRKLKDIRISVTDRCNFRCTYCMPFDNYKWIDRSEILSFEEISRIVKLFIQLGVQKVRLTGGEPLSRKGLERLASRLSGIDGLSDISITTNASMLAQKASKLKDAGLKRINISLDSINPERFRKITGGRGNLTEVLEGVCAAKRVGFNPIKINTVIERGINDEEILDLASFAKYHGFAIRFIEYMDVGNSNGWHSNKTVSKKEILKKLSKRFLLKEVGREKGSSPSVNYKSEDGKLNVGVIASVTEPFCSSCTRMRLTADGRLVTCLFASGGLDIKSSIRQGVSDKDIIDSIKRIWLKRNDRYSEERLEGLKSREGYDPKKTEKIEMISLGG